MKKNVVISILGTLATIATVVFAIKHAKSKK